LSRVFGQWVLSPGAYSVPRSFHQTTNVPLLGLARDVLTTTQTLNVVQALSFRHKLVTGWLHTLYYRVAYAAGEPRPQPGHPKYAKDRRIVFTLVIASYLLYTIYEVDWQMQREGSFYQLLKIPLNADEKRIQTAFRRLYVSTRTNSIDALAHE